LNTGRRQDMRDVQFKRLSGSIQGDGRNHIQPQQRQVCQIIRTECFAIQVCMHQAKSLQPAG